MFSATYGRHDPAVLPVAGTISDDRLDTTTTHLNSFMAFDEAFAAIGVMPYMKAFARGCPIFKSCAIEISWCSEIIHTYACQPTPSFLGSARYQIALAVRGLSLRGMLDTGCLAKSWSPRNHSYLSKPASICPCKRHHLLRSTLSHSTASWLLMTMMRRPV